MFQIEALVELLKKIKINSIKLVLKKKWIKYLRKKYIKIINEQKVYTVPLFYIWIVKNNLYLDIFQTQKSHPFPLKCMYSMINSL